MATNKEIFRNHVNGFRDHLQTLDNKLKDFTVQSAQAYWVWISDAKNEIGGEIAHYEIIQYDSKYRVMLHIEIPKVITPKYEKIAKEITERIDNSKVEWGRSHYRGNIYYKEEINEKDEELFPKLAKGLLYIEEHFGEVVRAFLKEMNSTSSPNNEKQMTTFPLNQILYGPPGTGKTYNTINKALEILGVSIVDKTRKDIKGEFDKMLKEGRIVFTTFHQSMSYEDFIEGIKPQEPIEGNAGVTYKVDMGLFRRICIEAAFEWAQKSAKQETETILDFSIAYDRFVENIEEKFLNGEAIALNTKAGGSVFVDSISSNGNIIIKHHDGLRTYIVSKPRLSKLHSEIDNLEEVSNINDHFRDIIGGSNASAYWAVLNAIRQTAAATANAARNNHHYSLEDKRAIVSSLSKEDYINPQGNNDAKPYVLIIDEINRGNVSQIFGELITLIEEDKRLGRDEALEVTLPYSKERFGVPPNLYIIGTMNTADRSVEALDAALRRRFVFEEMPPKPDLITTEGKATNGLIEGIDLARILSTINNRIELLLDKDHQIGHSYFMKVASLNDLKLAFQKSIIPLLQEYFFGDYGKIGLVLGEGFVEKRSNGQTPFAKFGYDSSDFADRDRYTLVDVIGMADEQFKAAIKVGLLGESESSTNANQ